MKRAVSMLVLVLAAGCGGVTSHPDDNDGDNNPPPGGSVKIFSATVNGVATLFRTTGTFSFTA